MSRLIHDHKRHGCFHVPEEMWADPLRAAPILAVCVPYEIRRSPVRGDLEVFAYALGDCFREVPPHEMIPEYAMNLVQVRNDDPPPGRCMAELWFDGFVEGAFAGRVRAAGEAEARAA